MTGYSGRSLAEKLGIGSQSRIFLSDAPENYLHLLTPLPDGAQVVARLTAATDIVHIFSTSRVRLRDALQRSLAKLRADGTIWVSWPKKSSRVPTDVTEETIRELALPMGLVDVKVCAIDDVWSGLKLVRRKATRKNLRRVP